MFGLPNKSGMHPIDTYILLLKVGKLASRFGRRLSMACIGMADEKENFGCLNDMVTEALEYGSQASFGKPSLDADSLSNIISSLATSLTSTKTEMTELRTGKAKQIRTDIVREKQGTPDNVGNWDVFNDSHDSHSNYVNNIWVLSYR